VLVFPSDKAFQEAAVNRPCCKKCGGKLVYESYPLEDMLVSKCFVCGKIDKYRELTREESRRLFRRVDGVAAPPLAS
jgi:hypothetical protein